MSFENMFTVSDTNDIGSVMKEGRKEEGKESYEHSTRSRHYRVCMRVKNVLSYTCQGFNFL